ncbi:hypothetical protein BIY29_03410 [Brenneria alni]|uniref:Aldehyde dehydrogenase domain-containing protein n=1 Tax=Brenneria alni TaxID=71656 RepID=A0A421DSI1_9GAMM|nr:aldehyde dehydrogenase family protein [Brenneria alni]RLM27279.1 hypothetical protein BIY29_03410 [Brenneria alni]
MDVSISPSPDATCEPRDCQRIEVSALGRDYMTQRRVAVNDLLGVPVADMAVAPPIYIHNTVNAMKAAPALPLADIHQAMAQAADRFQHDTIAGLSADEYCRLVQRTTGLPLDVLEHALTAIANALRTMPEIIDAGMPRGARWLWRDPDTLAGCSLFSRRGDSFAVLAAGNGPGIHALWPQAVALGYRTLVKPSSREPFTAQRVVSAMAMTGLEHYVALIPTDYRGAEELVASADLTLAYGGPDIVEKYRAHPTVRVQGPGRSKMVIGVDADRDDAASLVAKAMTDLGGAACVSTSAVLVEGEVADFCQRLRQALQQVPPYRLPYASAQTVERLKLSLGDDASSSLQAMLTPEGYLLHPVVIDVAEPDDPRLQREFPFPCVTVAPYHATRSVSVLAGSLVVTVFSGRRELLEPILEDASISNVYIGDIPTTWMSPLVPHDDYLSEFLMCNRGLRVSASWAETMGKGKEL